MTNSTNARSLGANASSSSSEGSRQAVHVCSKHWGSPVAITGRNAITNDEPGSDISNIVVPALTSCRLSSSRSSRRAVSESDSLASTFPPGNSQRPPCRLWAGRWQTRSDEPRLATQATTRRATKGGSLLDSTTRTSEMLVVHGACDGGELWYAPVRVVDCLTLLSYAAGISDVSQGPAPYAYPRRGTRRRLP
jgi:hypothetical protein